MTKEPSPGFWYIPNLGLQSNKYTHYRRIMNGFPPPPPPPPPCSSSSSFFFFLFFRTPGADKLENKQLRKNRLQAWIFVVLVCAWCQNPEQRELEKNNFDCNSAYFTYIIRKPSTGGMGQDHTHPSGPDPRSLTAV
jgi:hypothetical protein